MYNAIVVLLGIIALCNIVATLWLITGVIGIERKLMLIWMAINELQERWGEP
jgi:hypothetical protein